MGRRVERLGLLGGTFDPPHFGHLWLAETAREQLQLDKVCFLPVGDPVHKQNRLITAVSHRIQMTQLAIQNHPHFCLDTLDSEREAPHTTVSLIPLMQKKIPPCPNLVDYWGRLITKFTNLGQSRKTNSVVSIGRTPPPQHNI